MCLVTMATRLFILLKPGSLILRPRSHSNANVPFYVHSSFCSRYVKLGSVIYSVQVRLFTPERNDCVSDLISVETRTQWFVPISSIHPFQQRLHPCIHLWQKSFFSSSTPHYLFIWERDGTIAYCSTVRINFVLFHFLE